MLATVVARFVHLHPKITVDWEVNESQLCPDSSLMTFGVGN